MQRLTIVSVIVGLCAYVAVGAPVTDDEHTLVKRWDFIENNDPNMKVIPSDCDEIVEQYANGQMVMFEYKAKMARCLKGKEELRNAIVSKYEGNLDDSDVESAISNAEAAEQESKDDDSDDDKVKKDMIPEYDNQAMYYGGMPQQLPQQQVASYYPNQGQSYAEQPAQYTDQSQASFAPNPLESQMAPVQQPDINNNPYARSDIPAAPQQVNQWMSNAAPAQQFVPATKKDNTPVVPSDSFAQFMTLQSSPDAASQVTQQVNQQRSYIQPNPYPMPAPQAFNTVPAFQQASLIKRWSPEDDGIFPENP